MTEHTIEAVSPKVERIKAGEFTYKNVAGEPCIGHFHIYAPEFDWNNPSESNTGRESALESQLMVAWQRLLQAGFTEVKYKSVKPHPIFSPNL